MNWRLAALSATALLCVALLGGCNAICLMSMDSDIPFQEGDDMVHPAWYGFPACMLGDMLP